MSSLMSKLWKSNENHRFHYQSSRSQKKNLKYIEKETERAPPLPAIMRYELEDSCDWGDFPPDEAYFCDAEWGL